MKYDFDTEIAKKLDVNSAILFSNIQFWCAKNKANKKNYNDGRYWTYNSTEAFSELFQWLTKKQIRLCLEKLEENGYISTGNYNKSAYDRTKWYACNMVTKMVTSKCPNGQMEKPEESNQNAQIGEPIPYNKPDSKHIFYQDSEIGKKQFLKDWNEKRTKHMNQPSYASSLRGTEYIDAFKEHSIPKIKKAMVGLFKQKRMPDGMEKMRSTPKHFLKDNYIDDYALAFETTNANLYGTEAKPKNDYHTI